MAAVSLLMGVFVTLGIAAIAGWNQDFRSLYASRAGAQVRRIPYGDHLRVVMNTDVVAITRCGTLMMNQYGVRHATTDEKHGQTSLIEPIQVPTWARPQVANRGLLYFNTVAFGLPFRCLSLTFWGMGTADERIDGCLFFGRRVIPTTPVWPALLADIAVWGVAWWLLFAGLISTKRIITRRRRLARNLCPHCAYDLKNQPTPGCPECGWLRAAESLTTPPA